MRYEAPRTVEEAVGLISGKADARILAGGTDLLVRMRFGHAEPEVIVDIKRIDGMRRISARPDGWLIGAAVSGAEMGENAKLRADWPGVVEGTELIGSTQVQGRATMAGNLCNASPAADSVPALVTAGAMAVIAGPDGARELAVADVPAGPGKTNLKKGEFITAIRLPKPAPRSGDAYLRFIPRTEMDIAVVGCAVAVTLDAGGICTAARVALGAVAPTVIEVEAGAKALIGTRIDDAALDKLAAASSAAARPIDDKRGTIAFRKKVAGVLARRAAGIARDRAKAGKG